MNFTCPHCGIVQVATTKTMTVSDVNFELLDFAERYGSSPRLGARLEAVICANSTCKRSTVGIALGSFTYDNGWSFREASVFHTAVAFPSGRQGLPFPDSVPAPTLQDYREAWAVIDLSPKSAATLARRCLQAMIRDFCKIREKTLYAEIGALKKLVGADALPKGVESETIAAMDALREVGNIGAHMMENGGEMLDVEPGEAEALLALIEMLFADWYVARGKRIERLAAISAIAESKKAPAVPTATSDQPASADDQT